MQFYKSDQLYSLVGRALKGEAFPAQIPIANYTLDGIVEALWPEFPQELRRITTIALVRHALRIDSPELRNEYNSLKHGLRADMGSHSIKFAPGSPDQMPDVSQFLTLTDSEWGCHFLAFDQVEGAAKNKHFTAREIFSNWDLKGMKVAIAVTALQVHNIGVSLRKRLKLQGDNEFKVFDDKTVYETGFETPELSCIFNRGAEWRIPVSSLRTDEEIRNLYRS